MRIITRTLSSFALALGCFTALQAGSAAHSEPHDLVQRETDSAPAERKDLVVEMSKDKYSDGLRKWTPLDSVKIRYFDPQVIYTSPDKSHFFFVSYHGDVSCDCNIYELSVYVVDELRKALVASTPKTHISPPSPLWRVTVRSSPEATTAIARPEWDEDGKAIIYLAPDTSGRRQVHRLDLRSGSISVLTSAPEGILVNGVAHASGTVIFHTHGPARPPAADVTYPVHTLARSDFIRLAYPAAFERQYVPQVSYQGSPPQALTPESSWQDVWLAADGRRAVKLSEQVEIPTSWQGYDLFSYFAAMGAGGPALGQFLRFALVDAKEGTSVPLFDAPTGTVTSVGLSQLTRTPPAVFWFKDGDHAILVNTALPLTADDPERGHMAYLVGYAATSGKWEALQGLEIHGNEKGEAPRIATKVGWLKPGEELLVQHAIGGKATRGIAYRLAGGKWVARTVSATVKLPEKDPTSLGGGLSARVEQSANDPQVMVVSNGRNKVVLTPPDPALENLWLAPQQPFQWRTPSGKLLTGGLLLPKGVSLDRLHDVSQDTQGDPAQGRRLPLVIQPYYYLPQQFSPDGPGIHAYAAQSLVARGMAVLNIDIPSAVAMTPQELTEFTARINSAADALAARGLIDRDRIGLIGFSRAGYLTYYAITHPGERAPAAAVMDDSHKGTFSNYLSTQAERGDRWRIQSEQQYGGSFWRNKAAWLEHETSFNVDRIRTPALFTLHGTAAVPTAFTELGAFQLNNKPIEYVVFPKGSHQLSRPLERVASQELSVAWMAFWLHGEVPADPERARRWEAMKVEWGKQPASP